MISKELRHGGCTGLGSTLQTDEHPSPPSVLPSSHCSSPSTTPLPHSVSQRTTCTRPSSQQRVAFSDPGSTDSKAVPVPQPLSLVWLRPHAARQTCNHAQTDEASVIRPLALLHPGSVRCPARVLWPTCHWGSLVRKRSWPWPLASCTT